MLTQPSVPTDQVKQLFKGLALQIVNRKFHPDLFADPLVVDILDNFAHKGINS